ncbi:MAG TPA: peptidogalycan biosysnthesis protein, partial [Caulobacterales bacterium]|nr:peptidogalycan biosysnthesis protein [Caulobacterales bacterium]
MDGSGALSLTIVDALDKLDKPAWDAVANPPDAPFDPFLSWDFLQALEESGCVGAHTGWQPAHLAARDAQGALMGAMPLYAKDHSYGEYVFDHSWADAMRRAGGRYYPKLQCAVPFTPVPGRRILARDPQVVSALAQGAIALAQRAEASSVHITFAQQALCDELKPLGYLTRAGLQYHWFNQGYRSFDDFLAALASQKRKNVRRERAKALEIAQVKRLRGADIKPRDWDFFFR